MGGKLNKMFGLVIYSISMLCSCMPQKQFKVDFHFYSQWIGIGSFLLHFAFNQNLYIYKNRNNNPPEK